MTTPRPQALASAREKLARLLADYPHAPDESPVPFGVLRMGHARALSAALEAKPEPDEPQTFDRAREFALQARVDANSFRVDTAVKLAVESLADAVSSVCDAIEAQAQPAASEPWTELGELCMQHGFRTDHHSTLFLWLRAQLSELAAFRGVRDLIEHNNGSVSIDAVYGLMPKSAARAPKDGAR